jgi:hypothetical protein
MNRVRDYFARGRLAAVFPMAEAWEFQLAGSTRQPREGRFRVEVGNPDFENICTLLLTVVSADVLDIALKTTAPITPAEPAVVDFIRAVRREEPGLRSGRSVPL